MNYGIDHIDNHPLIVRYLSNLEYYLAGKCRAIISPEDMFFARYEAQVDFTNPEPQLFQDHEGNLEAVYVNGILLSAKCINPETPLEHYIAPLTGPVYCYRSGSPEYMPCLPENYLKSLNDKYEGTDLHVVDSTAKTLLEVIGESWMFSLAPDGVWRKDAPDVLQRKLHKPTMKLRSRLAVGGTEDRVADYGRLITVLFQVLSDLLTSEQKEALAPLLERKVSLDEIARISGREQQVHNLVDNYLNTLGE